MADFKEMAKHSYGLCVVNSRLIFHLFWNHVNRAEMPDSQDWNSWDEERNHNVCSWALEWINSRCLWKLCRSTHTGGNSIFLRWRFNDALSSVQMFKSACGPIFEAILPNIVEYSNQKFSSNVVEKAIETASQVNPIFWRSNLISNVGVQNKINRWYSQKWETYWPDDQQVWEFCDK